MLTAPPAPPGLQQSLLTMEEIQSVEETQIKERKCLLLKIRGGKQFVLQCDVSAAWPGVGGGGGVAGGGKELGGGGCTPTPPPRLTPPRAPAE